MSEDKLYAVKNDDRYYWDFNSFGFWRRELPGCFATTSKGRAEIVAHDKGGHIVTLIEEPEKVVLTKEQAEIVEKAHTLSCPAFYISAVSGKNEELIMSAYVNGYIVAKEKKYNVKVPHTEDVWYYKACDGSLMTICQLDKRLQVTFTEKDIEHYGLQGFEKEEVTDDDD